MVRARKPENKGLPSRWRLQHGAYYYQVPPGDEKQFDGKKTFRLGKTLPEAYAEWAKRIAVTDKAAYVRDLLDRYALQYVPTKAPATQIGYLKNIKRLRKAFYDFKLIDVRPQDIYKFHDKRKAKVAARREIALLSHALTKAVEWGYIDKHPFLKQVRLAGESPRDRYIEDWEILECMKLEPRRKGDDVTGVIQAYIGIKLLTGLRQRDLLKLPASICTADEIRIKTSKRQKMMAITITPQLRDALNLAKAARPVDIAPTLFCTRRGKSYVNDAKGTAHGFASLWQRFMERLLRETKVTERFTEHDIRAKTASDLDNLEHAHRLMGHKNMQTTKDIYERRVSVVMPLKREF